MSENFSGETKTQAVGKFKFWPFEKSAQAQNNTLKILGLVLLFAVIYTFFNRRLSDVLAGVVALGIGLTFFGIAGVLSLFMMAWASGPPPAGFRYSKLIFWGLIAIVAQPLVGVAYYSLGVCIKDTFLWVQGLGSGESFAPGRAPMSMALLSLISGVVLYSLRTWLQACYGLTEIVVGIFVSLVKTAQTPPNVNANTNLVHIDTTFGLAILTASVYLVVRGLDNLVKGIKEGEDLIVVVLLRG